VIQKDIFNDVSTVTECFITQSYRAVVCANFEAEDTLYGILSLKKGTVVTVSKNMENGWSVCEVNNRTGLFPKGYLMCEEEYKKHEKREEKEKETKKEEMKKENEEIKKATKEENE
jgi:hypothetical protein